MQGGRKIKMFKYEKLFADRMTFPLLRGRLLFVDPTFSSQGHFNDFCLLYPKTITILFLLKMPQRVYWWRSKKQRGIIFQLFVQNKPFRVHKNFLSNWLKTLLLTLNKRTRSKILFLENQTIFQCLALIFRNRHLYCGIILYLFTYL